MSDVFTINMNSNLGENMHISLIYFFNFSFFLQAPTT